ncbi:MAG: PASTA domain-containing protein [Actinomycetota bacterium]
MKRLTIAALLAAVLSLGVSTWALIRSYDVEDKGQAAVTTTTEPGATTTVPLVSVPTVVGKNGFFAAVSLEQVKLKSSVVRAPSVNIPRDRVIRQNPQQGTKVPQGTVIELTLSSGPP